VKNIGVFFRSLLFSLITFSTSAPLSIAFVLCLCPIPNKRRAVDIFARYWCAFILWVLKCTTGIKTNVVGLDKIDKKKSYIIVGKHESTWDTLVMHTIMSPAPVFILKKELLRVPFFGWVLKFASKIAIDRTDSVVSMKKIIQEGKNFMQEGHNIIIFPQGTRVPHDSNTKQYPYKTGFIALIKELKADIVPMALNSGKLWRKKQFLKYSGIMTMEFLEPIPFDSVKDLKKDELLPMLENIIETRCAELNKI